MPPSLTTEAKHTPTPWAVGDGDEIYAVYEYRSVAMVFGDERMEANAAFIVQCVNERSSLLSIIEDMAKALEAAKKRMRNCRGAIESNQVIDKDTRGSLTNGMADVDSALSRYTEFLRALSAQEGSK